MMVAIERCCWSKVMVSVADDELLSRTAPSALYTHGSHATAQAVVIFPWQLRRCPLSSRSNSTSESWDILAGILGAGRGHRSPSRQGLFEMRFMLDQQRYQCGILAYARGDSLGISP
jgi:hypothetical protein